MGKKIVTLVFLIIILFFMLSIFIVLIGKVQRHYETTQRAVLNTDIYIESQSQETKKDLFGFIDANINFAKREIDTDLTRDSLIYRIRFVEMASHYEKVLNWNFISGANFYDLGDGVLTELLPKVDIHPQAKALCELKDYLDQKNIDFLYVQYPYKNCKNDVINEPDYSNENADNLLHELSLNNISYLDIRELIHKENLNHHRLFYKTDTHWKAETGLWATKILSKYLNKNNKFEIDLSLFDPTRYRYEIYKNIFLGFHGRRASLVRVDPEDFTLIYPQFETNFTFRIPSRDIDTIGQFDVFYDYRQVEKKDYYNRSPYEAFLYSNNSHCYIHNNLLHDKKKVLFIKDSFSLVVAPFFSLGVEDLELLDLRRFYGSVRKHIEESMPDIVIVLYTPAEFEVNNTFNFR